MPPPVRRATVVQPPASSTKASPVRPCAKTTHGRTRPGADNRRAPRSPPPRPPEASSPGQASKAVARPPVGAARPPEAAARPPVATARPPPPSQRPAPGNARGRLEAEKNRPAATILEVRPASPAPPPAAVLRGRGRGRGRGGPWGR
nr:lysine-rich arabinogalactan protein 19-like [Lolium perenne]